MRGCQSWPFGRDLEYLILKSLRIMKTLPKPSKRAVREDRIRKILEKREP